jgi:copper chaperone CopZ
MSDVSYRVPDMTCVHCKEAVSEGLLALDDVDSVDVDLDTKTVLVHGSDLDDAQLREAIAVAGYEAV